MEANCAAKNILDMAGKQYYPGESVFGCLFFFWYSVKSSRERWSLQALELPNRNTCKIVYNTIIVIIC